MVVKCKKDLKIIIIKTSLDSRSRTCKYKSNKLPNLTNIVLTIGTCLKVIFEMVKITNNFLDG